MELGIGMLVTGSLSLLGFAIGFLLGAVYALNSVRKAIEGTKHVR
jgi:hypothetical protein